MVAGRGVASIQEDPEGWGATDKFTMVFETSALNAIQFSACRRERGLCQGQVQRWRQAEQDANEKPVLTLNKQRELEATCTYEICPG